MIEPCTWIGGQATSQGVSALDEHRWIEQFGGTTSYCRFRQAIRGHYQRLARNGQDDPLFNPGRCWVSRLSFEPTIALAILEEMLAPHVKTGRLQIFREHDLKNAEVCEGRIESVTLAPQEGPELRCQARFFIDATELGDLLPLAGARFRIGAEAQAETGESHAPLQANPLHIQSFTFPFIVEFRPGENHIISKPADYEENRERQPYTLNTGKGAHAQPVIYKMFSKTAATPGGFWDYRRLIDASQFKPEAYGHDLAMINWHSNDYRGGSIIDGSAGERERALAEAKALSLGFLYWLQTEAPRDGGGFGYPELKLRPDLLGTADGLSQFPYVRESRRIRALELVREQHITVANQTGARSRLFDSSVGIGHYWLDIHKSRFEREDFFAETRPFQVPLGALIPSGHPNLIAGAKNIGTTHLTNGAYRLHPIEWAIGEAAGALAAEALRRQCTPEEIHRSSNATRALQLRLAEAGTPIFWFVDVPQSHPAFAAVQWLAVTAVIQPDPDDLLFVPDQPLGPEEAGAWLERAGVLWDKSASTDTLLQAELLHRGMLL